MAKIGIDIGGTNIAAGLVAENGTMTARRSLPFPRGKGLDAVLTVCDTLVDALCAQTNTPRTDIEAVGVAVPGSLDAEQAVVLDAHNLGFHHTPLKNALREQLALPVTLINDADAAVLAEHETGALRGCDAAILITIGTGIGSGLILNNRLYRGGRGNGTEAGHMVLYQGGRACTCGVDGCAETYCSATGLAKDGAAIGIPDAHALIDAAKAGDVQAQAVFDRYIDDLGSYLASLVNLLDPDRIAIGGGVSAAGAFLLEPLRRNAAQKCFFPTCTEIVLATAGNDAGMLGAALIAE